MKNDDFILKEFLNDAFNLKSHLIEFLSLEESDLEDFLRNAKMNLASLHPGDALGEVSDFYEDMVGDRLWLIWLLGIFRVKIILLIH